MINQVQFLSLAWQSVEVDFDDASPLGFSCGSAILCKVTAWISLDTTESAIVTAAQDFGERNNEPDFLRQLYQDSFRQVVMRFAASAELAELQTTLPEIPAELMKALGNEIEGFHQLHRVTF